MRINGFEQIKSFYSWVFDNQDKGIKSQHISLYLFLINQNNRNNWIEWFKCPYDLAMGGSCISSKKTYYACLKDLQGWNLIQYTPGVNNWKAPLIRIEVLKLTSSVPQSEPQVIPQELPLHIQALIQATEPLPIHNIKLLTNNLKPITSNIEKILFFIKTIKTPFPPEEDNGFENFWILYDKKTDKPKAISKWNLLSKIDKEKIMEYIPLYKISQPDKKFRKDPCTFLNNRSWENEIIFQKTENPLQHEFILADTSKTVLTNKNER